MTDVLAVIPPADFSVVARSPMEMQQAHGQLTSWADLKLQNLAAQEADLAENIEVARRSKWRTSALVRQHRRVLSEIKYYEKVKAALDKGYYIVPNFDIDVFAVRTTRAKPKENRKTTKNFRWNKPAPNNQVTNVPALGLGEYHSPWVIQDEDRSTDPKGDAMLTVWADDWLEPEFPLALAKPEVLAATSEAMALKLFDEVGVFVDRRLSKGDPMVVGRIRSTGALWGGKEMSFVISWFLNTHDL